jgi:hypothetical protein
MRKPVALFVVLSLGLLPAAARAQEELTQQCSTIGSEQTRRFCNLVVEAVVIGQPRAGLAFVGGNPITGAASTLGMRIGTVPRIAANLRVTTVKVDLPPIDRIGSTDDIETGVPAFNADATLGLFNGFSLFPTVGGFASLDLLVSLGFVPLPENEGFNEKPISWALGARLGLLRESFTAPGITLSAQYRHIGDVSFGDRQLQDEEAYFDATSFSALSLRGVVGKRVLLFGVSAGVGWDRYKSDVAFGVVNRGLPGSQRYDFSEAGFAANRVTWFGGLQYTLLVLSLNLEAGYQKGGDSFTAPLPPGQSSTTQKNAFFGSLAFRLTI